ncbi:MAG: putative toxin-antitoxin system toxin component, PIN family [Bacteroidales bacterium]|nr:putative toxin-antitoxin system toxin component, PIN family [Bacteroidales bacterium]
MKVIFDCNIWVSLFITKQLPLLRQFLTSSEIQFFTTQELENEIRTVLLRKKFRKYVDVRAVEIFIYQISRYCEKIEIDGKCADVNIRDPKDIYLVTLSEETKADYLVSGDKDLLVIGEYKVTKFITLSEFKAIFFNK